MNVDKYDVVIIGAGLSGLVCAHTLSSYGIKCCVLEKSEIAGGGNQSFKNEEGDIFDTGYHALDYMRSPITSSLFTKAVNGDYHEYTLKRGLVMQGELFQYNQEIEKWPKALREIVSVPEIDDTSGDVSKDNLSKLYGEEFIDYCFKNVLQSYPSEIRAIKEGRSVSNSLGMIYPWFFPKVNKKVDKNASEWAAYHGSMRDKEQKVIYPKSDGFYGFIDGLVQSIDSKYCDIFLACTDIKLNMDKENQCIDINTSGKKIVGNHYFWCAPFFGLAGMLGLPLPTGVAQTLVLGSFKFDGEFSKAFHEILVGDNKYKINRISFPGNIRKDINNLIQVEFIYPSDELDMSKDEWMDHWLSCLSDIGISDGVNMLSYRFDIQPKGMVTKDPLDLIANNYSKMIEDTGTNIFVPCVNAGPENINRIVPSVIKNTINFITNR